MQITLSPDDLEPLVERVVERVLARIESQREAIGNKLAFDEAEAAGLLGLEPHVLRDERRRGRIVASRIVGRRIRYERASLLKYLADRRAAEGATA
jgi:Helix-turn-helix domain